MVKISSGLKRKGFLVALVLTAFAVFYVSLPKYFFYDYTIRVARVLLEGELGLPYEPPSHLNEFVPHNDHYYSIFPLGAVLSFVPYVLLFDVWPFSLPLYACYISAAAALVVVFFYLISLHYGLKKFQAALLALVPIFGTWVIVNSCLFGCGAWQAALLFALLGEVAALYFAVVRPNAFICGMFFALAFGNRTEIILTAPIYMLMLYKKSFPYRSHKVLFLVEFCFVPFILGVATLFYNYYRFQSPFDFGYARIPGVLDESWYKDGIFALSAIPRNFSAMLTNRLFSFMADYPFLIPTKFGGSILISCPLLLFAFWPSRSRRPFYYWISFSAVVILTFVLWCHGNTGGYQYSYRYATVLLPWLMMMFFEKSKNNLSLFEYFLIFYSLIINTYAMYLFVWMKIN